MTNVIVLFSEDRAAQGLAGAAQNLGGETRAVRIDEYQIEEALDALVDACRGADVVLLSNDTYSQELAPRLAHRLGGACVGDGTDVQRVDGRIRVTRQVYGGKANAVMELKRSPAVVWLRARSFAPSVIPTTLPITPPHPALRATLSPQAGRGATTEDGNALIDGAVLTPAMTEPTTRIVERATAEQGASRLEDARVIVSGGRGIGGPEGFRDELQPLADLLGAQMAASRAACDAGWVPPTWQVGQTGKKVSPELYLAIAITGASQHMAGISEARNIVVINIDPEAPIFKHARFGIVEDYRKVVPLLREKLAIRVSQR